MQNAKQSGHGMIEVMLVLSILIPLVFAVTSTTHGMSEPDVTRPTTTESTLDTRETSRRILQVLKSAKGESLEIWNGSSWETALDDAPSSAVRFRIAEVNPTDDQTETTIREIAFVRDANEPSNGKDDDGDGLIDEGRVYLIEDSATRTCIASGIEQFWIRKRGAMLELDIQTTHGAHDDVLRKKTVDRVDLQ